MLKKRPDSPGQPPEDWVGATRRETLTIRRLGGAIRITFARPEQLNALNERWLTEFNDALASIEADETVRCVILTGDGRAFCAGADLKFIAAMPEEDRAEATAKFLGRATRTMSRLENLLKPVIGAVNGIATAAGLEILLCCDFVIAAESARIGDGHANYGLIAGAGASVRLPRLIGANRAKRLLFTGDLLPARYWVDAGLIDTVVPDAELHEAVDELADRIAQKSPIGLARMKMLANAAHDLSLQQGLDLEQTINRLHFSSHDRQEGLAAFAEKRKPRFTGR